MSFPFQAEAQYEFEGANEGEMTVYVGEVVTVTAEADGGWYVCTNESGKTGYVPAGFLEARLNEGKAAAEPETKESKEDPKGDEKSGLKKRVSSKKLDSGAKVKSSKDKKKTDEKKKEDKADKKEKKKKKGKTSDGAATNAPEDGAASSSQASGDLEPRESHANGVSSASSSASSTAEVPSTSNAANAGTTSTAVGTNGGAFGGAAALSPSSPRARALPDVKPASDAIGSPHASTSLSSPLLRTLSSNAPSNGSPPNSADRKLPPVVPQKRIAIAGPDSARSGGRSGVGDSPPAVPKRPSFSGEGSARANVPVPPPRTQRPAGTSTGAASTALPLSGVPAAGSSSPSSGNRFSSPPRTPVALSPSASLTSVPGGSSSPTLYHPTHAHSHTLSSDGTSSPLSGSNDFIGANIGMVSSKSIPVIPSHTFDDEKAQRRFYIVKELATTEPSYVAGLEDGVTKFMRPLLEAAKTKSPQHVDDVKSIFSVMEHLLPLNQNLLVSLEERVINWTTSARIGDIIAKFAPFLKMYTTYSNNYDTALQVLQKIIHEPFVQELGFTSHVIENILITPIQRIPRYSLLLTDLLANTATDHPDQADIARSLATIKDVADHVNKGVGIYKNVARLTEAGLAHLLAPHRTLIKDGTITVVKANTEKKRKLMGIGDRVELKKHQWHFLLFSDTLVYINQALDENLLPKKEKKATLRLKIMDSKPKEKKEQQIPLYLIWLLDPGLRTGFDLIGPSQTMHLYFATAEERDVWWADLEANVRLCLDKSEQIQDPQAPSPATTQLQRKGRHYFTENDWYDGQWDNGKIHGKGKMQCTGATFEGVFDSTFETGSGTITYPTGMKFTGDWRGGKPTGAGTMSYPGGEIFTGEFKDGKRNGKGVLRYKDGSTLDCEWRNDLSHGQGTLTLVSQQLTYVGAFSDGKFGGSGVLTMGAAKYEGFFKDNQRTSRGKMVFSDGAVYEGEWKDDRQHGSGKFSYTDGGHYEGEWKTDARDGRGLMKWANGDEYIGQWTAGRPNGSGNFTYKSGNILTKYDGDFQHGKRHGKGIGTYVSGARYEGEWSDDLPNGVGKMTQANQVTIEGRFVAGVADARCVISVKGVQIVHSILESEQTFPQVSEVPLIPNFEGAASAFFAASH